MRVAIVHDWLIGGGAEQVVLELHRMFPNAPIYTSYCTDDWRKKLDNKVVTGYLQKWPFSKIRKFLPPLRALWFSRLRLDDFDLVISSSGAEAKFINVSRSNSQMASGKIIGKWKKLNGKYNVKQPLHISYIHAPTHYYWSRYDQYLKHPGFGAFDWLARLGLKALVGPMRRWDFKAAQKPDQLIANSNFTKAEIKKYYGRDSTLIHPPVGTDNFKPLNKSSSSRSGFVVAGRQTPYKRIDLAVAACTEVGVPLTVIGDGPEHRRLKKIAGPTVKFVQNAPVSEMAKTFQSAEAFIFPGLDDFGIVAVEAMAAGTPVIAFKGGGALDYIIPGKTGLFFDKQTADGLITAIETFKQTQFNSGLISEQASSFSASQFHSKIKNFIKSI